MVFGARRLTSRPTPGVSSAFGVGSVLGLIFASFHFFLVLPTHYSADSRGAARVMWLLIQWHRTVLYYLFYFCSLCYAFSARYFPPPRGAVGSYLSISCWCSPFFVSPPSPRWQSAGDFLTLVSLIIAPVFSLNCLSSSSPPRHAGGPREVLDVGLPSHIACVFLQLLSFAFFWLHSLAVQRCGCGF